MIPANGEGSRILISNDSLVTAFLSPDNLDYSPIIDYELGGVALNDTNEGLRYQTWTIRVDGDDILISAPEVAETVLFTAAGTSQVSLAFDQNMRPAVAFVQNGVAKLRWYDTLAAAQVITEFADAVTPRVCLDDKRETQTGTSDIILAYVRDGDLYFRAQRDRFGVEYLLKADVGGTLVKVGMMRNNRLGFEISPTVGAGAMTITNAAPNGETVSSYSHQYIVTGGLPPYVFSVVAGSLPTGLTLSASGLLSGTPSAGGSHSFTVQVADSTGAVAQLAEALDVSVLALSGDAPNAATSTAYTYAYTATGGTAPYAFDLTAGSLPPGITLNATNGTISGTPTTAGAYTWTVRVTDAADSVATVADGASVIDDLSITNAAPDGVVSVAYSHTYAAAGGVAPYTWALSGSLPTGFSFNTSTGELSGTTTDTGTYPVTITVTDAEATEATLADSFAVAASAPFLIRLPDNTVIEVTGATIEFRDAPGKSIDLEEL